VVHDLVGPSIPTLQELYPFVATQDTREIVFGFVPDKLGLDEVGWRRYPDDGLCDRGDIPLRETKLLFPVTSHA
jgi:hypothetical protein